MLLIGFLVIVAHARGEKVISEIAFENHRCLVVAPSDLPADAPLVFVLHGLGANAYDLLFLSEELQLPPCKFVLPDAPLSLPGYGPGAYAWYDFPKDDRKEIVASREYLLKVMDRFVNGPRGKTPKKVRAKPRAVVLMGFSEGGVMTLEGGLHYPGPIAALVCMSGYLPDPAATLLDARAPFSTPILLIHGTMDPVVPIEGGRRAAAALGQRGYRPEMMTFPMNHTISLDSIAEAGRFIRKVLAPKP